MNGSFSCWQDTRCPMSWSPPEPGEPGPFLNPLALATTANHHRPHERSETMNIRVGGGVTPLVPKLCLGTQAGKLCFVFGRTLPTPPRNGVSTTAFPNGVWEREGARFLRHSFRTLLTFSGGRGSFTIKPPNAGKILFPLEVGS
jgi:hypothetical protein